MVAIPQITRDKLASSVVGTPEVDTSGQKIGSALAEAGQQVGQAVGEFAVQQQHSWDVSEANITIAKNKMDTQALLEQYKVQYANNPDKAGENFWKDVQGMQENDIKNASNWRVGQLVSQRDPLFDGRIGAELGQWQYQQKGALIQNSVYDHANKLGEIASGIASDNTKSYPEQLNHILTSMDAIKNLAVALDPMHPEKQQELTKQVMGSQFKNIADAYVSANPSRAIQFLNDPATKQVIPEEMRTQLLANAVTHAKNLAETQKITDAASTTVQFPDKVSKIDNGQLTFHDLMLDDPHDLKPGSAALKQYSLTFGPDENKLQDASLIMAMHDRAYQLGLEARGATGTEKKDRLNPSQSIEALTNFQIDSLDMKKYMSPSEYKSFTAEVTGPLTALVSNLHTPGLIEQAKGQAGNFWNSFPWGDKSKAEYKVDTYNQAYGEINRVAQGMGKEHDMDFKLNALNKFFSRADDIKSGVLNPNDNNKPYNPISLVHEVVGQPVGTSVTFVKNGVPTSLVIDRYDNGQPHYKIKPESIGLLNVLEKRKNGK